MENKILDLNSLTTDERKLYETEYKKQIEVIRANKQIERKKRRIRNLILAGVVIVVGATIAIIIAFAV